MLATAHTDNVGVYLWSNRSLYTGVALVPQTSVTAPHTVAALPSAALSAGDDNSGEESTDDDADAEVTKDAVSATDDPRIPVSAQGGYVSAEQLDGHLVTLSALPRSRWENLSQLSAIKLRNKPVEPPKAPARAPFFLTTIPGLTSTTFRPEEDPLADRASGSHVLNFGKLGVQSAMVSLLHQCHTSRTCALCGRWMRFCFLVADTWFVRRSVYGQDEDAGYFGRGP
jgi:U3 small nucleolar RNA-associated protein 21